MTTYRELVYMVLDELKAKSDDFYYTEDHIIFLLEKYRAFLLKQKYRTPKSVVLNSNYMHITIKAPLIMMNPIQETNFDYSILHISSPKLIIMPNVPDPIKKEYIFNYCTEDRRLFLRQSQFLKNVNYFYFLNGTLTLDAGNKFFEEYGKGLIHACIKAIFESPSRIYSEYLEVDPMNQRFPLEESLISPLLEMVVKDLTSAMFKPEDDVNNGKDETGDLNKFMYQNTKSDLQKQIYG